MSEYITPVMFIDSSGHSLKSWIRERYDAVEDAWDSYTDWVVSGYKAIGDSLKEEVMVDVSFSIPVNFLGPLSVKIGVSTIINFEDKYIEFYPHFGFYIGCSKGFSGSVGVLQNYYGQGEYRGVFVYGEGGFFIGGGHSYDPFADYNDATKAYYLDVGKGLFVTAGADYYFWNENFIFDWGN